jgi:hypothetical protein
LQRADAPRERRSGAPCTDKIEACQPETPWHTTRQHDRLESIPEDHADEREGGGDGKYLQNQHASPPPFRELHTGLPAKGAYGRLIPSVDLSMIVYSAGSHHKFSSTRRMKSLYLPRMASKVFRGQEISRH